MDQWCQTPQRYPGFRWEFLKWWIYLGLRKNIQYLSMVSMGEIYFNGRRGRFLAGCKVMIIYYMFM